MKADVKAGVLNVLGIYSEPNRMNEQAIEALAIELRLLATWRGLNAVKIGRRGDLALKMKKVMLTI